MRGQQSALHVCTTQEILYKLRIDTLGQVPVLLCEEELRELLNTPVNALVILKGLTGS